MYILCMICKSNTKQDFDYILMLLQSVRKPLACSHLDLSYNFIAKCWVRWMFSLSPFIIPKRHSGRITGKRGSEDQIETEYDGDSEQGLVVTARTVMIVDQSVCVQDV